MKKVLYSILALTVAFGATSCLKDQEDLFDGLATERLQKRIQQIDENLRSTDTWTMIYFSSDDLCGGYAMTLSFDEEKTTVNEKIVVDKTVSIQAESAWKDLRAVFVANRCDTRTAAIIIDHNRSDVVTTDYIVKAGEGPTLSFGDYNDYLHMFSVAPKAGTDGLGYGGDYEFMVLDDVQSATMSMRGIKHRYDNVMQKLPAGTTIDDYLDAIDAMSENVGNILAMTLYNGDEAITTTVAGDDARVLKFTYQGTNYVVPFGVTATGIIWKSAVTIGGVSVRNFTYDAANEVLVCSDPGASNITLKGSNVPYTVFLSADWWYSIADGSMSPSFASVFNSAQSALDAKYGLVIAFMGLSSADGQLVTLGYDGEYLYDFSLGYTMAKQSDTQVKLTYKSSGNSEDGTFLMSNVPAFVTLSNMVGGSAGKIYTITLLGAGPGTALKFTCDSDSDNWFILYRTDSVLF